jgi:HlyD family secretion protein
MTSEAATAGMSARARRRLSALISRLAAWVAADPGKAETAGSPRPEVVRGLAAIAVFILVIVVWGSLARLDAGVYARGSVVVSGNRQAVQNKDGGIVSALDVREGDPVRAGQVLLRLEPEELSASERATADHLVEMQALQARLVAEIEGAPKITWPEEFQHLTGADLASADNAMKIEQREFATRRMELETQKAALGQRVKQLQDEIQGYRDQVAANSRQQVLIHDEIDELSGLLKQDLVPMSRVRALQRSAAELSGNFGQDNAYIAKAEQQIGETHLQISDLDRQRVADGSKDYREAELQIATDRPKLAAIREQIAHTTVRSPATGRVVGLSIFTVGGVVAPGQKLMDVVPQDASLVVEANVKAIDASDIHPGQKTEIRFPAFHDRRMPLLNGVISKVSADSLLDEKSGASFFRVEVMVPAAEARLIRDLRGADAGLRPGLPVEIVVPLRNRTALDYLTEPLRRMLWRSFREH